MMYTAPWEPRGYGKVSGQIELLCFSGQRRAAVRAWTNHPFATSPRPDSSVVARGRDVNPQFLEGLFLRDTDDESPAQVAAQSLGSVPWRIGTQVARTVEALLRRRHRAVP